MRGYLRSCFVVLIHGLTYTFLISNVITFHFVMLINAFNSSTGTKAIYLQTQER